MKISLDEESKKLIDNLALKLFQLNATMQETNRINTEALDWYQQMVEKSKSEEN